LALLLGAFLALPATAEQEPTIPMEPIHVTAPWPLTPPRYKQVSKVEYPEQARAKQEYGTVVLFATVSSEGTVSEVAVKTSSGFALLDEAAARGVKGWEFVPATRGPRAVTARVEIPVKFELVE
jgi:protein TonB